MQLIEAYAVSKPTKKLGKREAEIVILEEGPGNKRRKCYYGVEALESGKEIFRGCQVFSDHPGKSEQDDLPERSVRDLIGRIKETWVSENEVTGRPQLRGVLKIYDGKPFDWAVSLIKESLEAEKEGFPPQAQVSIHADGDIKPRTINGEEFNYVDRIKSAVSVDIVTKGGIKNSGFVNFMESLTGGNPMSENRDAHFRKIQSKLAESMSDEDAKFLESYLAEQDQGDQGGEEVGEPEVFEDEAGNMFAATGEVDANGYDVFVDEAGNAVVFPEETMDNGVDDGMGDQTQYADGYEGDEEVGINEFAQQFPALAQEIDQDYAGVEESDYDQALVSLECENRLLKSREIAEAKLTEAEQSYGLPQGSVLMKELVGKSPDEMDTILESRIRMFNAMLNLTESAVAGVVETTTIRESNTTMVGKRVLRNSTLPF